MDYCLEYKHLKDNDHIFKQINIDQLLDLLDNFSSEFIFIGGSWCKNCQAIIDIVNDTAKRLGIDIVYNYDPKFTNIFGEVESLIQCKSLETKLKYYQIVEKIGYKSDEYVKDTFIPLMRVPFFIAMRNGSCVGYYSVELIKDKILHYEDDLVDRTDEFIDNITELMRKTIIHPIF